MSGNVAVDTNIIIAYFKGEEIVNKRLEDTENIYVPFPVAGEMIYGALKSNRSVENLEKFILFMKDSKFVPCDFEVVEFYAKIRFELKKIGTPIPENDIWIAACCMRMDIPLATRDNHYHTIKNLERVIC